MTVDEMRTKLNAFYDRVVRPYDGTKLAYEALGNLVVFFGNLPQPEKDLAARVLDEWLLSDDASKEYVARWLMLEHKVASSLPVLRALRGRLASSDKMTDRNRADAIGNLIRRLETHTN